MNDRAKSRSTAAPTAMIARRKPKASIVFDSYWKFASERQSVFMKRIKGEPGPWTNDPVLSSYKFTNCYRASDRVSQHLIKRVIYQHCYDIEDTIFRILLFKIFNKIETWDLLEQEFGGDISLNTFDVERYSRVLDSAKARKISVYSAAYIMPSGVTSRTASKKSKHRFHLELLDFLRNSGALTDLVNAKSMKTGFEALLALPSIGPFLAYQYVTDLNYSDHFDYSEQEFVVPGPGAKDGIRKCFSDLGDYTEADIIRMVSDEQEKHFERLGLPFESLWGRRLQLIDCQNLFCEVDKYSRKKHPEIGGITGRSKIKQKFTPTTNTLDIPWYPPKWGINKEIAACAQFLKEQRTANQKSPLFQQSNLELFY